MYSQSGTNVFRGPHLSGPGVKFVAANVTTFAIPTLSQRLLIGKELN